ncbi:MAG: type II secretion system F family protein [Actinomycetota bacterium]
MTQLEAVSGLGLFIGLTLLLSLARWFGRQPVVERLRPYSPGGLTTPGRQSLLSVESFRDVVAPLSQGVGAQISRLFGVSEDLETKLRRIHSPMDVGQFRTRQLGYSLLGLLGGVLVPLALRLPPSIAVLFALGAPLLTFLVLEQQIVSASEARQQRLFRELPVVAEQLGMLLAAGYSLGAALHRIATRGSGVVAEDLRIVIGRMRQGLGEAQALEEWAELADVAALDRLVAVLALNREAGDLGTLISDEARAIRREAHRDLLEAIERKDQQVWIPVAVAALIPGTILIAIPFIQAMRTFSNA